MIANKNDLGHQAVRGIAEVLGLDPDEIPITKIELVIEMDSVVRAMVTVLVNQMDAIQELLKTCKVDTVMKPRDPFAEEDDG